MTNLTKRLLLILSVIAATAPMDAAEPRPVIVAHRGLLRHAPENTLANFRACLELRLGFEFDVQKTKDGQLICIHDATVDRTTNGQGQVTDLALNEIRQLDAGSWFDPQFAGEKAPTVEEVLKLVSEYRQHNVLVAVDLKAADVEEEVVRLAEKHNVLEKLLFIGRTISSPTVRSKLRRASAKVSTAAVANNVDEFSDALNAPNANWVYFRYLPRPEQIEAVRRSKKQAFIAGSTVSGNLPDNWRRAAQLGLNAILTDYPLELRACLQEAEAKPETIGGR